MNTLMDIMKVVRLGMTEGGLLLLSFVLNHCDPDENIKPQIYTMIMSLVNWLYTTSGYYDKTVSGNYFNFNETALNSRYIEFIKHLEQSVTGCERTQFFFHDGLVMSLYEKHKEQFMNHYNIKNIHILNGTVFIQRMESEFFLPIKNKKVLVISSFDGLIQSQYNSGNVYKVHANFPNLNGLSVVKFPYCFFNNGPHQNYFETMDAVFEEVKKKDFDIALVSCGSYGHMMCHKIHQELNKDAIYVGGSITVLFGILATREKNHCDLKINEYWVTEIPEEYKPPNYKMIENGCYW